MGLMMEFPWPFWEGMFRLPERACRYSLGAILEREKSEDEEVGERELENEGLEGLVLREDRSGGGGGADSGSPTFEVHPSSATAGYGPQLFVRTKRFRCPELTRKPATN